MSGVLLELMTKYSECRTGGPSYYQRTLGTASMISAVDAGSFWTDAYFKETQLASIQKGKPHAVIIARNIRILGAVRDDTSVKLQCVNVAEDLIDGRKLYAEGRGRKADAKKNARAWSGCLEQIIA
jgi:hypothetical protein